MILKNIYTLDRVYSFKGSNDSTFVCRFFFHWAYQKYLFIILIAWKISNTKFNYQVVQYTSSKLLHCLIILRHTYLTRKIHTCIDIQYLSTTHRFSQPNPPLHETDPSKRSRKEQRTNSLPLCSILREKAGAYRGGERDAGTVALIMPWEIDSKAREPRGVAQS